MTTAPSSVDAIRTTHGAIALLQLEAQIEGLEHRAAREDMPSRAWADLIDLITLQGQILGRVASYERAAALAEWRADAAPDDGLAFLSRARARASLHRFAEAMQDLDHAAALGLSGHDMDVEKAAILQAVGRYDEAMAIRRDAAAARADFEGAAGLASLFAEIGDTAAAERWFDESCQRYRGVSPFALAQLEFQRGHMWMRMDLGRAHGWLVAALRRLPCYAQAEGHLAEVEYALGDEDAAITRLSRLAAEADDPDYAAELARILRDIGREEEADAWRARAEARYEELIARHLAAFADHAARFWLSSGDNPSKALDLARFNLAIRDTPQARRLLDACVAHSATPRAAGHISVS